MTLRHSYPFFYDGTSEIPHERRKGVFYQTNCWDFWAVENPCDDFFFGFFSNQFGMVKSLHLIFLRGFRWLVDDWISKTSPRSPLQRFHDHFHTCSHIPGW